MKRPDRSRLARIVHKPLREVPEMPVIARKTTEPTAGVFERYVEDRRARMTPPALADTAPQQRACEESGLGGICHWLNRQRRER
jgi:hypothetical protein